MKQTQFFSIEINKPLPAPVQFMMSMMTSQILNYVDSLKAQKIKIFWESNIVFSLNKNIHP